MPVVHELLGFSGPNLPIGIGPVGLDTASLALWQAGVLWNVKVLQSAAEAPLPEHEPERGPVRSPEPSK